MTGAFAQICKKSLPLLALLASVTAAAQELPDRAAPAIAMQQSAPTGERTYVVEAGDTLWSIAEGLYDEPWYWPSLWSYNPQITNPHLIYPGDVLYLSRKSSQTNAEKTITFATSRYEAKPKSGIELVRRVGYISSRDYRESGVLEASREERNMLGQLDEGYVRFNTRRCAEDDKAKAERDALRASEEGEAKDDKKSEDDEDEALVGPCVRDGDRYVVNGKKMKPRHGRMNVLNVTFICMGRAIQYINSMMREKAGSRALKQPALLFLISISFLS